MKKTYIATVPNHIGAFLAASRRFAALGINITRVSYNKAVDSHTIFIEAEGSGEQLAQADRQLEAIGYLHGSEAEKSVVLLEFQLRDEPGGLTDILALIEQFGFNISYLSSQENGTDCQFFKMGLFVDDPARIRTFLAQAEQLCPVRVIDYNRAEKSFDNSIFYDSFVTGLCQAMDLPESARQALLVDANLAMQTLDERGLSPYRTFDSISRFAELLSKSRGEAFCPRITACRLTEEKSLTLIEPPCGSNTAILTHGEDVLFLDSGYACYEREMLALFRQLVPDFDRRKKTILVTHADVDHCGLLPVFDEILVSAKSAQCLRLEAAGQDGFREQNPLHKPYIQICKLLTGYCPAPTERLRIRWGDLAPLSCPLAPIGEFSFGDLQFSVYEGAGGHLPGEIVLVDETHQIAFTGDIYVNIHGMTAAQTAYNQYAPILMTSVDTDPKLCAAERKAVFDRLSPGDWQIFGAHGAKKDVCVQTP